MGSVNFKLPKGVDSGQYLKLENFGDFRHGEIGDLVIQIELIEKDGFEKMNNDLIYNLFLILKKNLLLKFIVHFYINTN